MIRLFFFLFFCAAQAGAAHAASASAKNALDHASRRNWEEALPIAKQSGDKVLLSLVMWQYVMDTDSGASFAEITRFIDTHEDWPEQTKLRVRAELSLRNADNVPDADIIAWFDGEEPLTGIGRITLAYALRRAKMADETKLKELIRTAWINGDFEEPTENTILSRYGQWLTSADHAARTDRLLWEERESAAKRMLQNLPEAQQHLAKARLALMQDSRLASVQVAQVPSSLKHHPGLIYERMRYRARRGDDEGVRDLLLSAPKETPYPEKWWRYRESQARQLAGEGQFKQALKLIEHHGLSEGASYAEAKWMQGWIKCEFTDQPREALADFATLYEKVRYPVSRARAAYWAGRAAERVNDAPAASSWFAAAASHTTTFYGQLALLKRAPQPTLSFPSAPSITSEDERHFKNNEPAQAARLAAEANQPMLASRLIALLIEESDDSAYIAQLVSLGTKADSPFISVRAAKRALQQNVVLVKLGYPTRKTPGSEPIEPALTLGITRQESEFDPRAKSPSGALGMMQLLKGTAKETAEKNDLGFNPNRLYEPDYNMLLGSLYLKRMINNYDGSYVMAIASYNAGPGNVRKWVQRFGTPENKLETAINWIELLPFAETRNYVQRVLENVQVYRALSGHATLMLDNDLKR